MTAIKSIFSRHAMALAFVTIGVLGTADTQAQGSTSDGWFKACSNQGDNHICNTQFLVEGVAGQLVTAVNFLEITGNVNRRLFQVSIPTGRSIAPGVSVSIDGGQSHKIDYALCFTDRCIAEMPLTDALIDSFKYGSAATITSTNFQNRPNPVEISLAGFAAAIEGEPIALTDVQQRQQDLDAALEAAIRALGE